MTLLKNKKAVIAIGVALFLTAIVLLLRSSSANYYITPQELRSQAQPGRARVAGQIVDNTIEWKQNEGALHFTIRAEGEKSSLPVTYKGFAPEGLVNESEVIVEGTVVDKKFQADAILVKCPENYLPERMVGGAARTFKFEGTLYR